MATSSSSTDVKVTLTEADIDGASIDSNRLDTYTIPALRWWLLCRGVSPPTSWKKSQIVEKVRTVMELNLDIVDVDGFQLYRKQQKLTLQGVNTSPLPLPDKPLVGWEVVDATNYREKSIPVVTHGVLYTYLAKGCERISGHGAFRALNRGYVHWASGRMGQTEMNLKHPDFCHVRCIATPSMKTGKYNVYILLGKEGELATIKKATCECAAGQSASCTHVSALLHALTAISNTHPFQQPVGDLHNEEEDNTRPLPVTSYICQWVMPRKRKENTAKIAETDFIKHVYGRTRKHELKSIADFDPRPSEFRGSVSTRLPEYLKKVRGQGNGIAILLDTSAQVWSDDFSEAGVELPSKTELEQRVSSFIESLSLTSDKIREIERNTIQQHQSSQWYSARRYRLTASMFGDVLRRRPDTPPDSLVLRIIEPQQFSTPATEWGKENESLALEKYEVYQKSLGHNDITVCRTGFVVCESHPFLGASPDAYVYDPHRSPQYGVAEIKCPYKYKDISVEQACSKSDFCAEMCTDDAHARVRLKRTHRYYSQIQGQMAITGRSWCDFVLYTTKGIVVDTIKYDEDFWRKDLLPSLDGFYRNCVAPEIVSPIHLIGLPMRDLRKSS